jgi:hypothetical protein
MLECQGLWISAPLDGRLLGLETGTVRHVKDLATRAVVGRARYRPRPMLAAWRATEVLRVEEGADLSDLCLVRRLPWWEAGALIVDADGQAVARWRDSQLELPRDGLRATVQMDGRGGPGRAWVGGASVAEWAAESCGIALRFLDHLEGRPFVRMAVLAVVLMEK